MEIVLKTAVTHPKGASVWVGMWPPTLRQILINKQRPYNITEKALKDVSKTLGGRNHTAGTTDSIRKPPTLPGKRDRPTSGLNHDRILLAPPPHDRLHSINTDKIKNTQHSETI